MIKADYVRVWRDAAASGTLLTEKHDPRYLLIPREEYRSVTCMPPDELAEYILAGEYSIRVYRDFHPKHGSYYCVLTPWHQGVVPGSGVPAHSTTPTTTYDRFVVVLGPIQGWHLIAESAVKIQRREDERSFQLELEFL